MNPVVRCIERSLAGIESHPALYGTHLETVELVALVLHEIRELILHPERIDTEANPQRVIDLWRQQIHKHVPEAGKGLLWELGEAAPPSDPEKYKLLVEQLTLLRKTLVGEFPPQG